MCHVQFVINNFFVLEHWTQNVHLVSWCYTRDADKHTAADSCGDYIWQPPACPWRWHSLHSTAMLCSAATGLDSAQVIHTMGMLAACTHTALIMV